MQVMGTTTAPMLQYLGLVKGNGQEKNEDELDGSRKTEQPRGAMELESMSPNDQSSPIHTSLLYDIPVDEMNQRPRALTHGGLHQKWIEFDREYMQPLFGQTSADEDSRSCEVETNVASAEYTTNSAPPGRDLL